MRGGRNLKLQEMRMRPSGRLKVGTAGVPAREVAYESTAIWTTPVYSGLRMVVASLTLLIYRLCSS